jgi:hypothetical protein
MGLYGKAKVGTNRKGNGSLPGRPIVGVLRTRAQGPQAGNGCISSV